MPSYSKYAFGVLVAIGLAIWLMPMLNTAIPEPPVKIVRSHPVWVRQHPEHPANWKELDVGEFSLYAPPGTVYRPIQGIDSTGGEISGPDFKFQFELGMYAPEIAGSSSNLQGQAVLVDGRPATLWTASSKLPMHFVYLVVPQATARSTCYGCQVPANWNRLSAQGSARTTAGADKLKRIYSTISFSVPRD